MLSLVLTPVELMCRSQMAGIKYSASHRSQTSHKSCRKRQEDNSQNNFSPFLLYLGKWAHKYMYLSCGTQTHPLSLAVCAVLILAEAGAVLVSSDSHTPFKRQPSHSEFAHARF